MSTVELAVWGLMLMVGCYLFFHEALPALESSRKGARVLQETEQRNRELRERLELLRLRREALARDPEAVEIELRNQGYAPPGAVRVVPERPPDAGGDDR